MNLQRGFWKTLLLINWGVILFYWFSGSYGLLSSGLPGAIIALGRLSGLSAAYMILLQFFFMGRLPFLERVFGLDNLSRLHQRNGKQGFYFLVAHPILLTLGYSSLNGSGWWAQFLDFFLNYRHVPWAVLGLVLFVTVVATSIRFSRSRVKYESWYFVHLLAYGAVFASFWHQIAVGGDILANRIFYGYWIGLYSAVFSSHLVFRFLRPVYLFYRHQFRVVRVERESPSAVSIYISGRAIDRFSVQPGQFMIVRFLKRGLWWQAHPFSLSMVPNGTEIRITVKGVGDFTREVPGVGVGTQVFIDGPYGIFTDLFSVSPKALLIAGGIGITPLRSLMEEMLRKGKEVVLLYGNRTREEIVFREELAVLAERYSTRVVHVLSNESVDSFETGRIDEEKIKRLVPDLALRDVYVCGPVPMMEGIVNILKRLGVKSSFIHYEKFEF